MGRFFSGLAQQGAWACFDEFNRIDIEVLSVIAQQILCIQQAISKKLKEFDFENKLIPLNYAFGVFITMNPGKCVYVCLKTQSVLIIGLLLYKNSH